MKEFIEKLIGRLEEESYLVKPRGRSTTDYGDTVVDIGDAIDIVNQLAEEYKGGWIPCSERLPEIDGNTSDTVLVCTVDGYRHMAFWCDDGKWRYCESGEIKEPIEWVEIIAWQPLPKPCQTKGE